jgi:hypothetical protein
MDEWGEGVINREVDLTEQSRMKRICIKQVEGIMQG